MCTGISVTENRRAAEELEAKARRNAWREVKLGQRRRLEGAHVQAITREVMEEPRALKRDATSPAAADRYMALLELPEHLALAARLAAFTGLRMRALCRAAQ
jgi:hypothetical protein